MWSVHENQTRNEPRGKDSLLKKQGQENWPPTRKNIREGHPLGYPTEIQLKTHHLHLELSPPPALPPPKCAEMDRRSALSRTQETSTSSSFSPLAAPPYRRALRQPHSSQPGCSPVTPEPKPWGPWGDKAPAREEWAAPRSRTSEGSPRSSSAVSAQTESPNWNRAKNLQDTAQHTAREARDQRTDRGVASDSGCVSGKLTKREFIRSFNGEFQVKKNKRVCRKCEILSLALFASVFSSVQFSRSVVSDSSQPHESQHTRPPCFDKQNSEETNLMENLA